MAGFMYCGANTDGYRLNFSGILEIPKEGFDATMERVKKEITSK